MPTFEIEFKHKGWVGGVDEAGRGPLAGPVVAAIAVFHDPLSLPAFLVEGIQDSKKLTKIKREYFYHKLIELNNFHYSIGKASVEEIDQLNISKATFLAMERAVQMLSQKPETLLIDGKYVPTFKDIKSLPIIGGDDISLSIAAASILAKVTRDEIMATLALEYPLYGWERNAGYGTQEHQEAIKIHGITIHHRRSFAPIQEQVMGVGI